MRRRHALMAAALPLAGCTPAAVERFATLADAQRAVEALRRGWRSRAGWDLPQTLQHLAQSVEYSLRGFPQPYSAAFQATAGKAAFAWFESRGRMSHSLTEPIPGAPALATGMTPEAAVERLLAALRAFEDHAGPLAPHFAYGALDKPAYARAHLMHLANHWSEFEEIRT